MGEEEGVVIDNGSGTCKAGFAGDDTPRSVLPTIVGRRNTGVMVGCSRKDFYVGDEAQSKRGILTLNNPIEDGIVTNWDDMEKIWNHIFCKELHTPPETRGVLLAESPLTPRQDREKMTEIMFEKLKVPFYYPVNQQLLGSYAMGQLTSTVLDSGYSGTHVVACFEGHALSHSFQTLPLGGRHITDYFQQLLTKRGYSFNSPSDVEIVRDLKEHLAYVALDYDVEMQKPETSNSSKRYLPDGQDIRIGKEGFQCTEPLFHPELIQLPSVGIHEMIHKAIQASGVESQRELSSRVILSGGSTMFTGLPDRLSNELSTVRPRMKVIAFLERRYSTWIGGSVMASLRNFKDWQIAKQEYEERGSCIVHRKCF